MTLKLKPKGKKAEKELVKLVKRGAKAQAKLTVVGSLHPRGAAAPPLHGRCRIKVPTSVTRHRRGRSPG